MLLLKNLKKIEKGNTVLDIDEIQIEQGEIVALVGAAESGLSTLMRLLTGDLKPSAGQITVNDLEPGKDKDQLSTKIGFLFKENGLYINQTANNNLLFFAKLFRLPKSDVEVVLHRIGLADQTRTRVRDLPSGLSRRLAFGRAILNHPSVLILEQPFEQCDEKSINVLKEIIRQEAINGTAIFILDEDDANLEDLCNRILKLKDGRISEVVEGPQKASPELPFKIPVKLESRVVLLNPGEILFIEAAQGQTILHTTEDQLPSQFTLSELENRLKRSGFFRAHRSYLVNLQHVQEVIPYSRNSFSLRLSDSKRTEIPLSKNAAAELRDLLNY